MSSEITPSADAAMRRGTSVFYALAVLTAVEFLIAIGSPPLTIVLLAMIALVKATMIIRHFMHSGHLLAMRRR